MHAMISTQQRNGSLSEPADGMSASTLRREHERTARSLGNALRAHQQLSDSTRRLANATHVLTGQLGAFCLP